jgi:hypothetical protein
MARCRQLASYPGVKVRCRIHGIAAENAVSGTASYGYKLLEGGISAGEVVVAADVLGRLGTGEVAF